MKHLLYSLLGILLLAGCKEDKYNVIIPMSDIYLSTPQDGAIIDLNDLSIEKYSFSWEKLWKMEQSCLFVLTGNSKNRVIIDAGKSTSVAISALTADQSFSQLGIKAGQEAVLYWTVKETGNITAAASEARTIRVKRMTSKLVQPEDLTKISLAENAPETAVQFEWDTQEWPESTSYSLCFSLDPEMKQTVAEHSVGVVNGKSSLTHEELQALLDKLSIKRWTSNSVYWNVKTDDGQWVSRSSGVLNMTEMMRFIDVRGDEKITYRVAKVKYSTGEEVVWLAENLRTTKYPDGTDISLANGDYWNAPSDISEGLQKAYGKYYSIKIVDKIVSDGWKMPTFEDYKLLLNESLQTGSADVLKHRTYWNWSESVPDNANAWGIGLVPGGYVQYVGANEKVINYNQADNNCYLLTRDLAEQVVLFSDYGMRTKEIYNVNAWGGAPARFIYIGK